MVFVVCYHSGCLFSVKPIYYDNDKRLASQLVDTFHNYLDEGNYEAIYEIFGNRIRAHEPKEQFIAKLKSFRLEVGKVKSAINVKMDITPHASSRLVHMIFRTEFEKKAVLEEFDCLVDGQNANFDFYGHPEKFN